MSETEDCLEKSKRESCNHYEDCSANICPLDFRVKEMIWCPDENEHEEVCRNKKFANLQFIRTQKKIARVVKKRNVEREDYFTYSMLDRNITVKSGIVGVPNDPSDSVLNPMKWYADREGKWIGCRPSKKELSQDERERRRERMISIRKLLSSIQFSGSTDSKGITACLKADVPQKPANQQGSAKSRTTFRDRQRSDRK